MAVSLEDEIVELREQRDDLRTTIAVLREQLEQAIADRDLWRGHARRTSRVAIELQATLAELGGAATNVARAAIGEVA